MQLNVYDVQLNLYDVRWLQRVLIIMFQILPVIVRLMERSGQGCAAHITAPTHTHDPDDTHITQASLCHGMPQLGSS